MMDGSPASLLYEWQSYAELEPFGSDIEDLRNALLCSTIANGMGGKKGGGRFKPEDFRISFDKKKKDNWIPPSSAQAILKQRYGNNSKSRR